MYTLFVTTLLCINNTLLPTALNGTVVLADNRLKDRLNTGYLITGLYYDTCRLADSWVYNCYYYFWYCMLYRIA